MGIVARGKDMDMNMNSFILDRGSTWDGSGLGIGMKHEAGMDLMAKMRRGLALGFPSHVLCMKLRG